MIHVEKKENLDPDVSVELAQSAVEATLSHQLAPANIDLTIVLTDDHQLHELNLQWMSVDAPTDVLSFPSDEIDPESGNRYMGDILISVQRAAEQARTAGHSTEAEVQLLVVHGVLHLIGHDHAESNEKAIMWAAQADILSELGLGGVEVRE